MNDKESVVIIIVGEKRERISGRTDDLLNVAFSALKPTRCCLPTSQQRADRRPRCWWTREAARTTGRSGAAGSLASTIDKESEEEPGRVGTHGSARAPVI